MQVKYIIFASDITQWIWYNTNNSSLRKSKIVSNRSESDWWKAFQDCSRIRSPKSGVFIRAHRDKGQWCETNGGDAMLDVCPARPRIYVGKYIIATFTYVPFYRNRRSLCGHKMWPYDHILGSHDHMIATFVDTNGHKSIVTTNVVTNHLWWQMWSPKCVHEYMILLVASP